MKKHKKIATGDLQIEVDCSRKKKLKKILKKAFPNDHHKLGFLHNPVYTKLLWIARCEVHDHMWAWNNTPLLNVKVIKLSQYGKNGDKLNI
jgi:hypothetical protein